MTHPNHPGYTVCLCELYGVCPGVTKKLHEAESRLSALIEAAENACASSAAEWSGQPELEPQQVKVLRAEIARAKRES